MSDVIFARRVLSREPDAVEEMSQRYLDRIFRSAYKTCSSHCPSTRSQRCKVNISGTGHDKGPLAYQKKESSNDCETALDLALLIAEDLYWKRLKLYTGICASSGKSLPCGDRKPCRKDSTSQEEGSFCNLDNFVCKRLDSWSGNAYVDFIRKIRGRIDKGRVPKVIINNLDEFHASVWVEVMRGANAADRTDTAVAARLSRRGKNIVNDSEIDMIASARKAIGQVFQNNGDLDDYYHWTVIIPTYGEHQYHPELNERIRGREAAPLVRILAVDFAEILLDTYTQLSREHKLGIEKFWHVMLQPRSNRPNLTDASLSNIRKPSAFIIGALTAWADLMSSDSRLAPYLQDTPSESSTHHFTKDSRLSIDDLTYILSEIGLEGLDELRSEWEERHGTKLL